MQGQVKVYFDAFTTATNIQTQITALHVDCAKTYAFIFKPVPVGNGINSGTKHISTLNEINQVNIAPNDHRPVVLNDYEFK